MAYTKNTWTDEVLAGNERYDIKEDGGAAIESNVQINLISSVAVAGSPVSAARMNNIENGIEQAHLAHSIGIEGCQLIWNSVTSVTIGVGSCFAENGDFINVTSALVKSGLSLSASTWYHIYVYLSAGVTTAEVVTTAPVAWKGTAYSKTGDTSRRYVGSIKTDGSSNVYAFVHSGNRILYNVAITASPFRVLSAGTATSNTAVSVADAVPVTTVGVILYLTNLHASVIVRLANSSGANIIGVRPVTTLMIDFFTDASQNIYYNNSAGSGNTYIDVFGYVLIR